MTSKTYDSVTDKFMDFSFEKTNSAYMLFYERCPMLTSDNLESSSTTPETGDVNSNSPHTSPAVTTFELSKELEDWIWQDNMHFIQDKNIFEHTYFNFMWQICGYIPQTILPNEPDVTQKATQLSTSFFIETFIHAKEKPTMVQWVELVTKQFNACPEACVWFLDHMANDTWWPVQVLLKCPNQMVRQMYQRLCIHVIQRLKQSHSSLYLEVDQDTSSSDPEKEGANGEPAAKIGNGSCVTKFIKTLLSLMEHGAKPHLKHLTEYFGFLFEFSRMGEEESKFLLAVGAIHVMVNFYLGQKANDFVDVSEGEEEEEVAMPNDKYKPASLDKMITLVASLVEKSRDSNMKLQLSEKDCNAVAEGKGFPFLYQQIKDNINLQQTRNLIHSLCRGNNHLAQSIICMISQAISKHSDACQPFFKILTLLTEGGGQGSGGSSSQPCFTQLVLQKVWEAAECCPYSALDWLALQVTRNRLVHQWVMSSMDSWLEHYLIANGNQRVRNAAGYLLVSLVPSTPFRQGFRATHRMQREPQLTNEAQTVLHQIYTGLLRLLASAKHYCETQSHGTMKLTTYFALLMYCCISKTEKLMFGQYFLQLWHLFHPKLSEPSIPAYHNKQALLAFWNHVCTDCPENVQLMLQNAHVTKNIAFNYILADHDDQDIVLYNRAMLPAYYGLLRMMCQHSRIFTRHLAQHQNLQWAFKNITPHPTQYTQAVEELFKLMQLMVFKHPDTNEAEQREICTFRRTTLMTYLQCLDGRTSWGTLISAFKILLDSNDDKLYVVYNGGLQIVFECFQNLHVMLHEATACHVSGDLLEILTIMQDLVRCVRNYRDSKDSRGLLLATKDWLEVLRKLATLLNTYNPPEIRQLCIEILKEFALTMPPEAMQVLVPLLSHCHSAFQDSHDAVPLGPYFPRRGHSLPVVAGKGSARPLRPMVQMTVPHNQLECSRGVDPEYDEALDNFYGPYHEFIDVLFRMAVNNESVTEMLVNLSAVVGFEAVPLHSVFFPKLWLDVLKAQHVDRKYISMLTASNYFVDYVDAILLDERSALTVDIIYEFLLTFFPKVSAHVLSEQTLTMIDNTVGSMSDQMGTLEITKSARRLYGDIRALNLVYSSPEAVPPPLLRNTLKQMQAKVNAELVKLAPKVAEKTKETTSEASESNTESKPGTSQQDTSSDSSSKPGDSSSTSQKGDSEPEAQATTAAQSDDSSAPHHEKAKSGPLEDLKLLESVLSELLAIADKKA